MNLKRRGNSSSPPPRGGETPPPLLSEEGKLLLPSSPGRGRPHVTSHSQSYRQDMLRAKHNAPALKSRRRELRAQLTQAEATLWRPLQRRQLAGRKFRRQHSV